MTDLVVDLAALDSLTRNLDAIRSRLSSNTNDLDGYRGELGSGELEHALDSFHRNWKDGRAKIDANAGAVCKAGADISANLRQVDADLANGLRASMTGGPTVRRHDATVTVHGAQ